jgi:hypothetical protein
MADNGMVDLDHQMSFVLVPLDIAPGQGGTRMWQ